MQESWHLCFAVTMLIQMKSEIFQACDQRNLVAHVASKPESCLQTI